MLPRCEPAWARASGSRRAVSSAATVVMAGTVSAHGHHPEHERARGPFGVDPVTLESDFGPGELPPYGEVLKGVLLGEPVLPVRGDNGGGLLARDRGRCGGPSAATRYCCRSTRQVPLVAECPSRSGTPGSTLHRSLSATASGRCSSRRWMSCASSCGVGSRGGLPRSSWRRRLPSSLRGVLADVGWDAMELFEGALPCRGAAGARRHQRAVDVEEQDPVRARASRSATTVGCLSATLGHNSQRRLR